MIASEGVVTRFWSPNDEPDGRTPGVTINFPVLQGVI